jgi:acetyltransferase-like isoleucine patch superfamily enzyme
MSKKLKLIIQLLLCLFPNLLKIPLYRVLFGAVIGNRVQIGFGALLVFDTLTIGDDTRISPLCLVRVRHLTIGQRTKIGIFSRLIVFSVDLGPSVTIGPQVSILASDRDPRCVFSAGAETWIFEYCYINPARPIRLGRNVGVGGGSYIFGHGLWLSKLKGYPVGFGEVTIGNDVWLPWGCFIMPGVEIGDGSVVGARSLVTKSVPAGSLVAGSPAKLIRPTVAIEPSIEQQLALLQDATQEFCQLRLAGFRVDRQPDWVNLYINGKLEISVATQCGIRAPTAEGVSVLHVIHDKLQDAPSIAPALFSLRSYQCSPRSTFTELQSAWLVHLRQIGARYYPIDEVNVEQV